jgi:putative nucleotidyltransferase with HDIG domain
MTDSYDSKILIIDDETILAKTLTVVLQEKGYEVKNTAFGKQGLEWLSEGFDLVLLDLKLPDIDGLKVLKTIQRNHPKVAVIVMTAYASIETAIDIMKEGAYSYLMKPFEMDELLVNIQKADKAKKQAYERQKMLTNLSLLYQVSKEMEGVIEVRSISLMAARYFQEVAMTDVCAILLRKEDANQFNFTAIVGGGELKSEAMFKSFQLEKKMAADLILHKKILFIPELKTKLSFLSYIPLVSPKTLFVLPLIADDNVLGLAVFISEKMFRLNDDILETIITIGGEVAACIKNANRYIQLKQNYLGAVKSLAKKIEDKYDYNKGHSEGVSEMAVVIARKMGFPAEDVELIRFAGLVHDIGKVTISDKILCKKDKLTPEEYMKLKMHAVASADIVRSLEQEKRLLPIILYHHERFDGSGYPEGLSRDRIPIGARILAVCDAYKAMTSSRPYRRGMSASQAIRELSRCSGSQFDPEIIKIFIQCFKDGHIS